MASKKRVLAFQTPKKKAATPLRLNKQEKVAVEKDEIDDDLIENKLIEAYREENEYLRNMKRDGLLYSKLLGVTINELNNKLQFTIERDSSSEGYKKLRFSLEDRPKAYIFSLEEAINCNVPEFFYDVFEFEKDQFLKLFYKAMQSVHEARTNEAT